MLEAIQYKRGSLKVLNQLRLPFETVYDDVKTVKEGFESIRSMKVRGAPAIAIVAALSLAVDLYSQMQGQLKGQDAKSVVKFIQESLIYLEQSRPTAVNLHDAAVKLSHVVTKAAEASSSVNDVADAYLKAAEQMLKDDVSDNENIGKYGAEWILKNSKPGNVRVLTHCNTGSLATAGYGTALGVIRSLHSQGNLEHAYCTETRPYNQGSRLTAYELVHDKIPATLVTDSMASALISIKGISAIVVGADRVAANGDTANKIGTLQLSIVAKHFGIPFIVAAPTTSIDLNTPSGKDITIEERKPQELTNVSGLIVKEGSDGKEVTSQNATIRMAAHGIGVWNPAFDVVPASLISAMVTERGVIPTRKEDGAWDVENFVKSR